MGWFMSPSHIGEVVRLAWPTVTGLITLVALTARREMLGEPTQCEPVEEIRETERLYRALWEHAHPVTLPSSSASMAEERRSLRLVS
jgi:hypothetical protein